MSLQALAKTTTGLLVGYVAMAYTIMAYVVMTYIAVACLVVVDYYNAASRLGQDCSKPACRLSVARLPMAAVTHGFQQAGKEGSPAMNPGIWAIIV